MTSDFASDLALYGPQGRAARPTDAQAQAYCSRLARTHYENFAVASLLLPRRLVPHFHNIYAYCRWADDLADETGSSTHALNLLAWWRSELLRCYEGEATHPVFVALKQTIRTFAIPPQPFLDLLLAFEQDQHVKRYDTFAQLLDYCKHSANPVGRLVLYLCQAHDEQRAPLSDAICTGLQLANFWQDVARDWDIGRIYLPREDLDRFGYTDADFVARRFNVAFTEMLSFQVRRAQEFFARGTPLTALMPREVRADIDLFVQGGLGILRKIEQAKFDVWSRRPTLSKWDKGRLLGRAVWQRLKATVFA